MIKKILYKIQLLKKQFQTQKPLEFFTIKKYDIYLFSYDVWFSEN